MSRLITALLIPAALSLCSTASVAKEIKGAPKAMFGTFAESPEQCRAYFQRIGRAKVGQEDVAVTGEKDDEEERPRHFFKNNGKDYYSSCLGKQCQAQVLSHRVMPKGFVLDLKYNFAYGSTKTKLSVTKLGANTFGFHFNGGEPFTAVRCSRKAFEPDE
jgi:hypothetical protein